VSETPAIGDFGRCGWRCQTNPICAAAWERSGRRGFCANEANSGGPGGGAVQGRAPRRAGVAARGRGVFHRVLGGCRAGVGGREAVVGRRWVGGFGNFRFPLPERLF